MTNDESALSRRVQEMSPPELVSFMLREEDVDRSYCAEEQFCRIATTKDIGLVVQLLGSDDRFHNVVGLRILDEVRRVDITPAYDGIDPFFEQDDLTLKRLSMGLISSHFLYFPRAVNRVFQHFEFPDHVIQRRARLWFLGLSVEQLAVLKGTVHAASGVIRDLIEATRGFRAHEMTLHQFLKRVATIDKPAHAEFSEIASSKSKHLRNHYQLGE